MERYFALVPSVLFALFTTIFSPQLALADPLGAGGQSVGGPGVFYGDGSANQIVHDSGTARTLCVTLSGNKGTSQAFFDQQAGFSVAKNQTSSACRQAVTEIAIECSGGPCEADWRVDTVGGGASNSETTCDSDQYVSGIDATGTVICSSLSNYVNANCAIYFGWADAVDGGTFVAKSGRVKGDGNCDVSGANSTCSEHTLFGDPNVKLLGINTDGDVDGNDKFYIGVKCSAPPPPAPE